MQDTTLSTFLRFFVLSECCKYIIRFYGGVRIRESKGSRNTRSAFSAQHMGSVGLKMHCMLGKELFVITQLFTNFGKTGFDGFADTVFIHNECVLCFVLISDFGSKRNFQIAGHRVYRF